MTTSVVLPSWPRHRGSAPPSLAAAAPSTANSQRAWFPLAHDQGCALAACYRSGMLRFLHSADWQLGMTRHYLSDEAQTRFTAGRLDVIAEIGELAVEED